MVSQADFNSKNLNKEREEGEGHNKGGKKRVYSSKEALAMTLTVVAEDEFTRNGKRLVKAEKGFLDAVNRRVRESTVPRFGPDTTSLPAN